MVEVRQANAPAGRPVIDRYGPGGFQVAGQIYTGPLLLLPDRAVPWNVSGFSDLTIEDFRLVAEAGGIEILLLGTGARMQRAPKPIRDALRAVGIIVDAMDSGAACRTYGVLSGELRQVAAALLPMRD